MIKKDNIGDVNKLYLIFCKADRLLLENCRMGQKAGSFQGIQNKNQEEKNRKHPISWSHKINLVWGEKEQENKHKAQVWLTV